MDLLKYLLCNYVKQRPEAITTCKMHLAELAVSSAYLLTVMQPSVLHTLNTSACVVAVIVNMK